MRKTEVGNGPPRPFTTPSYGFGTWAYPRAAIGRPSERPAAHTARSFGDYGFSIHPVAKLGAAVETLAAIAPHPLTTQSGAETKTAMTRAQDRTEMAYHRPQSEFL